MSEKQGYSLSVIAGLFNLSETDTQRLAKDGIIPSAEKGLYDLVACTRAYISYLRKPKDLSKAEIAAHLDMSERNLTDVLRGLNLDYRINDIEEIRTAYIRDLREKAAGRSGVNQDILTTAKIRDLNASAEYKELQIKEKASELFSVKEFEPYLLMMITAAKQELLTLPLKLKHYIKSMHSIDIDLELIEETIHDSLSQLSTNLQTIINEIDTESDSSMETTD